MVKRKTGWRFFPHPSNPYVENQMYKHHRQRFHLNTDYSKRRTEQGFTLIEIMLVLSLIAILSTVTMPSFRGFAASSRLKSSARAIRDMLNFARDMAITERAGHLVVFDLDRNRYWLASRDTYDATDPLSSSITDRSSTVVQAEIQNPEEQPPSTTTAQTPTVTRTSMILGVPQTLNQNIVLSRMITNHNVQSEQVDTGVDYVYFSPTASAEDTILYLQDRRGKTISITVERATGRVSIQWVSNEERDTLGLPTDVDFVSTG